MPYYETLAFNDLKVNALKPAVDNSKVADISFVGLNYPTMSELWHKNRELRAAKINLGTNKDVFDLTGTTHYKSTLSINSKAASHTSSHCISIDNIDLNCVDHLFSAVLKVGKKEEMT